MKKLTLLLLMFPILPLFAAQPDDPVQIRGEEVFQLTCATGYCHGIGGERAGAPRLSARGFDALYIADITANGVEGTPMAGFSASLSPEDMNAVMSYIAKLNGIINPVFSNENPLGNLGVEVIDPRQKLLSGEPAVGRDLFFDTYLKGVNRCSSCHELEGRGIPVATPLIDIPDSILTMRNLNTPSISTALLNNENFPVLVVSQNSELTMLYDLSSVLPVKLTVHNDVAIVVEPGSQWQHSDYIQAYSDEELALIIQFLEAIQD